MAIISITIGIIGIIKIKSNLDKESSHLLSDKVNSSTEVEYLVNIKRF